MAPKLYYTDVSPAVRSTLLTIQAINLDVELIPVNLAAGEHLEQKYLKLNPLHTVPTLEDGDFVIFDSHAINNYLISKYGNDDELLPKDLEKRAVVEQRQHFDSGILFPRVAAIVVSLLRGGAKSIAKDKADFLAQGYALLESLLENRSYVAGEELTVADFHIIATISSANVLVPIAENRFPNIAKWMVKMQELPYYADANQVGLNKFAGMVKSKLS